MWAIMGVAVLLVAGASFYGGMAYSQNMAAAQRAQRTGGAFAGRGGRTSGGGFTGGEIIAQDSQSITVKLPNGSSQIVFFSDSTKIMKSVDGTASDLATGKQVTVSGTANPDGSITAQSIQLRPLPPASTTPASGQ